MASSILLQAVEISVAAVTQCRYSVLSAYAVFVYDWLISLGEEVDLIHQARWTSVKAAYLMCRYYPLLLYPFHIWGWLYDHDYATCKRVIIPLYTSLVPLQLSAQVVLMLRAYAFTGRRRSVLILLCAALAAMVGIQLWVFTDTLAFIPELFELLGGTGCFPNSDLSEIDINTGVHPKFGAFHIALSFFVAFLFDLLTMSIIVVHALWNRSAQGSLGRAFLKQGLLVFSTTSVLNVLSAAMYFTPNRTQSGVGSFFAFLLPNVLACRLVLMLRRRVSPTETERSRQYSKIVRAAVAVAGAGAGPSAGESGGADIAMSVRGGCAQMDVGGGSDGWGGEADEAEAEAEAVEAAAQAEAETEAVEAAAQGERRRTLTLTLTRTWTRTRTQRDRGRTREGEQEGGARTRVVPADEPDGGPGLEPGRSIMHVV